MSHTHKNRTNFFDGVTPLMLTPSFVIFVFCIINKNRLLISFPLSTLTKKLWKPKFLWLKASLIQEAFAQGTLWGVSWFCWQWSVSWFNILKRALMLNWQDCLTATDAGIFSFNCIFGTPPPLVQSPGGGGPQFFCTMTFLPQAKFLKNR